MTSPIFTIAVAEADRGDLQRSWTIPAAWLSSALADSGGQPTQTAGQFSVQLFKNGQDYVVRGQIKAQVQLPCARTLDPAVYDLSPELFLVLRRKAGHGDRPRAGGAQNAAKPAAKPGLKLGAKAGGKLGAGEAAKPGPTRTRARPEDPDRLLTDDDAASDVFSGETIVLDEFVREQIVLELPMFPLRSDLRSQQGPAIPPPPQSVAESGTVDPRLAPLQALKAKLKANADDK